MRSLNPASGAANQSQALARTPFGSLLLPSALLVLAILLPLIAVAGFGLKAAFSPGVLAELAGSVLAEYTVNTLLITLIAAAIGLGVGLPAAWFLAAYDFSARRFLEWSLVVPMALPAYVMAYAYTDALDPSGWLYQLVFASAQDLGIGLPRLDIRSVGGAGVILGLALSPYVSLLSRAAFEERQGAQFDAARSMGLSGGAIFFRLALPMARPAWIAGLALVVMECFADYGTVAFFSVPTLSTGLFRAWFGYGDRSSAALIALMMMVVVLTLLWIESKARGNAQWSTSRIGSTPKRIKPSQSVAWAMQFFCAIPGVLGFVFPVLLLVHAGVSSATSPEWNELFYQAAASIGLGVVAVLVIVAASWVCGYALRSQNPLAARAVRVASCGYAVPGLVIAVGLLAWSSLFTQLMDALFGWRIALVGTGILMLGAYLTRFFSVGLGAIETGLGRITQNLEWSASSLGLSGFQIFLRVHLPLMKRATGVAALLVFVDVVKELPATLVLRPFNLETLSIAAYHLASDELLGQAAWPALMIAVVGLIPILLLGPALKR